MARETVKSYSAQNVTISIGGQLINGYADGDFCSIVRVSDAVTSVAGSDGSVARARTNDRRHEVKITLLQTSNGNDVLTQLHQADEQSPGGAYTSMVIRDLEGTSLFVMENAWIKKQPDVAFGREVGSREWSLESDDCRYNIGGN